MATSPFPPASSAADLAAAIAWRCEGATQTSTGWDVCCPTHDDHTPSLSIDYAPDKVLLICRAHCPTAGVLDALGLTWGDLFLQPRGTLRKLGKIVALYDYVDAHGILQHQTVRFLGDGGVKAFRQRRPDPTAKDGWRWRIKDIPHVLYHLPDVLRAVQAGEHVYLVEGEKDADNLQALGLAATTNAMGSGSWEVGYNDSLRGAHLVMLPDYDAAGQQHMLAVAARLHGLCASITILAGIHTQKAKSDVSDWLAAGGSRAQLEAAVEATPAWTPTTYLPTVLPGANGTHPAPPDAARDPDTFYTDTFNARALVRDHGMNLRYCYAWKSWLVWTGTHWQRDTSGQIWQLAKQTIKRLATALQYMDDKAAGMLIGHIKSSLSTARQKAMVESAQNEPGIPIDPTAFDSHHWLLNCANGTLDLSTDTLLPHTREHLLTQYIPVEYDPHAYSPLWHTFLNRILNDNDELIAFVQRAVGYALTGVIREHVLIILWGSGRNGKSTLLMTILKLLGPYGLKAVSELLMASAYDRHLTERADLYQKRLVIVSETEQGRRLAESFTKDATGGENIRARRMHENTWEFVPTHKLLMATNHKPVIHSTDDAIWERMKLVPFTVTIPFEERDTSLLEKLGAELSGILTWAVLGCQQWRQYGLGEPEEVTAATQKYKDDSDPLGQFLADCCKADKASTTETSKLYSAYLDWCASQENMLPMKMREWGIGMTEHGFERDRGTANAHIRRGIRLVNGVKDYGEKAPEAQAGSDRSDLP